MSLVKGAFVGGGVSPNGGTHSTDGQELLGKNLTGLGSLYLGNVVPHLYQVW